MKTIKKITILTALLALVFSASTFAADPPPVDTVGTWALWHMDARTNWVSPPALPWYVHDDASANPGRTNDMAMAINNAIVGGGVYGNCIYFDGASRALSVNGWANPNAFYFECYIKPESFEDLDQRIFEITSAISIRFALNSSKTHGRALFYHYESAAAILANTGWATAATLSNQWLHLTASIDPSGNKTITMDNTTDGIATGAVVDPAYPADPRAFIGASRTTGSPFTGSIDEMKISAIPEPMTIALFGMGLIALIIKRK